MDSLECTVEVVPPLQSVFVCDNFAVSVKIKDLIYPPIYDYEFWLIYDPTKMTPVNAWDGCFLQPPKLFMWEIVNDYPLPGTDAAHCGGVTMPPSGGSTGAGT